MNANNSSVPAIYFICGVLALIILLLDIVTPLGIATGVLYIVVVLVSLRSPKKQFTIAVASACTLLVFIGIALSPSSEIALYQVYANRFLSILAIWVTAILALKQRDSIKQLHAEHLKYEQAARKAEVRQEKLKVLKATMQTVQDIVGNFLNNMQYFRLEMSKNNGLSPESTQKLNRLIQETSIQINELGNLEEIRERRLAGDEVGIDYKLIVGDKDTIDNRQSTIKNRCYKISRRNDVRTRIGWKRTRSNL